MKKLLFITLGLAAIFGLTACVESNPGFDPSKVDGHESVVTKFFLNISPGSQPSTKQMPADVQANGQFRGIDNATMFAFSLKNPDGTQRDGSKVVDNSIVPTQMYNLSTLFPKGTFGPTDSGNETNNRMFEVSLPSGTNAIIFYAQAYRETKTSTTGNLDNDEVYGKLEYVVEGDGRTTDMTAIGSKAGSRLNESNKKQYVVMKDIILSVFNHILRVGFNATGADAGGWDNAVVDSTFGPYSLKNWAIHWYDYRVSTGATPKSPIDNNQPASEIESILGKTYVALTTIEVPEIRSGAGSAIERQMADLYSVLAASLYSGAKNDRERVALEIIKQIQKNILYFFDLNIETGSLTWKSTTDVMTALSTNYHISISGAKTDPVDVSNINISRFPRSFHIPFGGATLLVQKPDGKPYDEYVYNDAKINMSQVYYNKDTSTFFVGVEDFTYTPELVYYCNAPIHTTEVAPTVANFNVSVNNWPQFDKWGAAGTGWTKNSHVESSTRGVALANNVHYGVSLLKSQVIMDVTTLKDNNSAINSTPGNIEQDKDIPVGNNAYLTWTGILVSGQPDKVGWTYIAFPESTGKGSKFSKMVYDKVNYINDEEEGYKVPTDKSRTPENYTILFDNYNPNVADAEQSPVFVALEFRNDLGVDFWGNANLVRQGGTFYIIGVMPPATLDDSWWNDNNTEYDMLPPYDGDGKTRHVPRVFMQNCITNALFHIGENSLKRAFTTVPDLRTARLSLGLSVDLNWRSAASYDILLGQ